MSSELVITKKSRKKSDKIIFVIVGEDGTPEQEARPLNIATRKVISDDMLFNYILRFVNIKKMFKENLAEMRRETIQITIANESRFDSLIRYSRGPKKGQVNESKRNKEWNYTKKDFYFSSKIRLEKEAFWNEEQRRLNLKYGVRRENNNSCYYSEEGTYFLPEDFYLEGFYFPAGEKISEGIKIRIQSYGYIRYNNI